MTNPEERTIGELRRALALGTNDQTITEALEAARKDDEEAARHQQATTAYRAYVEERRRRLQAVEEEAMNATDEERRKTGYSWPADTDDRYLARREAGLAARDCFEIDEPLLEFADWVEAGSPERYQAKTPAARRQARLAQLVRGGG